MFLFDLLGRWSGGSRISSSLDLTNKIVLNKEARKDRNFTTPTLYQFKKQKQFNRLLYGLHIRNVSPGEINHPGV